MSEEKSSLRRELRAAQRGLSPEETARSDAAILAQIQGSEVYGKAKRLFLYYSRPGEVDTHALLARAVSDGKTVALPVSAPGGEMTFYRYTGTLRPGLWNIPEPKPSDPMEPSPEDLMIVPGLSFDRMGYRLGQGGGYYDRYLTAHPAVTAGVCRARFLRDAVPRDWNDRPVRYIITEHEILTFPVK
ncbi:MAG: 5-formyltetrahydrofolate cyclo-ligase [Oscillospiraceae bacterium]|nr:5-formyltetrahydrofolate cyclo-ligase [Oscillospiraceae bacterium]